MEQLTSPSHGSRFGSATLTRSPRVNPGSVRSTIGLTSRGTWEPRHLGPQARMVWRSGERAGEPLSGPRRARVGRESSEVSDGVDSASHAVAVIPHAAPRLARCSVARRSMLLRDRVRMIRRTRARFRHGSPQTPPVSRSPAWCQRRTSASRDRVSPVDETIVSSGRRRYLSLGRLRLGTPLGLLIGSPFSRSFRASCMTPPPPSHRAKAARPEQPGPTVLARYQDS